MAQFTFTNNTYAGEALAGFMASTLLGADSVKRGLLTVINDVKARKVILDADDEALLQDPSGVFIDQGTTASQTETYLDPIVFEFMKQEQWDKLIQSWEAQAIKPGSFADYEGTVELSEHMVNRYLTKIQIANERLYWLGKSASPAINKFTASFTGLLPQMGADANVYKVNLSTNAATSDTASAISASGVMTVGDTTKYQDGDILSIKVTAGTIAETTNVVGGVAMLNVVNSYSVHVLTSTTLKLFRNFNDVNTRKAATFTGTATAVTIAYVNASNVLTVLKWVYMQFDPADRAQEDFNVQIPYHFAWAYAQSQADKATNVLDTYVLPKTMTYLGVPLQVMNHWQANTLIGARTSNLFLGVDLLGDESELSTVYLKPYTNDNVVRMKARMKAAVNYKFANEIFYLGF